MEQNEKMKIAERCREYRFKNRLSQKEMAELCGLIQCQISLLENGNFRCIGDENVLKVGKVVNGRLNTKSTKVSQRGHK
jgi:DNA-binding XRE family transcriptional regulator